MGVIIGVYWDNGKYNGTTIHLVAAQVLAPYIFLIWEFAEIRDTFFGGPYNNGLYTILGPPNFGKLPKIQLHNPHSRTN